jgi:Flp pilus assembly protein TadG
MKMLSAFADVVRHVYARACRFGADNRGVIMITGIFYSFMLIGACWFIFGVGSAITYREAMQNAADASAYGAAVYDARGMNLLALINLIMAAVLAVLVIVKVFQAIWIAVNVASCLAAAGEIGLNGFMDWVCGFTTENEEEVNNTVDDVQDAVKTILPVLHYAEAAIAVVWPWVAEGKSVLAAAPFAPTVTLGSSFAYSQIPLGLDTAGDTFSPSGISGAISGKGGIGGILSSFGSGLINGGTERLGLPVSDESFNEFCDAAIVIAFDGGPALIGLNSIPLVSTVLGMVEGLVEQFPGFFCGGGTTSTQSDASQLSNSLTGQNSNGSVSTTSALQTQCNKAKTQSSSSSSSGGSSTPPLTPAQQQQKYNNCMAAGTQKIPSGGLGSTGQLVPVVLYGQASMGSDYYGIWSTSYGEFTDNALAPVSVATVESRGPRVIAPIPPNAGIAYAKAEFYYEPQTAAETSSQETSIGKTVPFINAMYNMRWRARLRRFHLFPMPANIGAVIGLINGNYSAALSFASSVAGQYVGTLVPKQDQQLEKLAPASVQSWLNTGVTNAVNGTPAPMPTIIH